LEAYATEKSDNDSSNGPEMVASSWRSLTSWACEEQTNLALANDFRLQFSSTIDSTSSSGAAIMGRFGSFLLGFILGGAAVFGGLKYHVVHAKDGVHFVPKIYATFGEIYVDIRDFNPSDWGEHKALATALIKADKGHLMGDSATNQLQELGENFLEGLTTDSP
jgi:hypothetical protein